MWPGSEESGDEDEEITGGDINTYVRSRTGFTLVRVLAIRFMNDEDI